MCNKSKMKLIINLTLFISGSWCTGNHSYLGTGTSLAVCQPVSDTYALLSEVAAMKEKAGAMTQTQSRLVENLSAVMQKMAIAEANLQHYKCQAEELGKVNQAQDEQLKALKNILSTNTTKVAFTAALKNRLVHLPRT